MVTPPLADRAVLKDLLTIKVDGRWITDFEGLASYAHDETEDLNFLPELVFVPESALDISRVLKFCNERKIPVTARGGGTGLSGGALPVNGGLIVSLEKLNKIHEIDTRNLQATVGAGVITQVFMDAVEKLGLYYPVDPSSKGSSFLGGNVAHGSGGPRVVKYGTIREYILNLEVVLASGEIIWTGANTLKNSSGYNLTQLMIGSEGTLGIITRIVVKLLPKPKHNILLMALFEQAEVACDAVSAVFRAGFTPSALEFMERAAIQWVKDNEGLSVETPHGIQAWLMIELDGKSEEILLAESESLAEVLFHEGCRDVLVADTAAHKETWWKMRRSMAESVKRHSIYKEEDAVVPRAELARLLAGIKTLGREYGFESVCYGHAGDGNLHVNILKSSLTSETWNVVLPQAITKLFQLTVSLGGTISGEHGIGWVQRDYMPIRFNPIELWLMRGIKHVFDPIGILNPRKILPDVI